MIRREDISDLTPLRLKAAAEMAFPDGSMSVKGLRREIGRGRLAFSRIAGKDYVTLKDIDDMVKACRRERRDQDSGHENPAATSGGASAIPASGSLSTEAISAAQDAASRTVQALKGNSENTSPKNTSNERPKASVTRLRSPSPTS